MSQWLSPIPNVEGMARSAKLPISLLVGEMAGRPEGGAVPQPYRDQRHSAVVATKQNFIPHLAIGLARSIFFPTANGWKRR
jgi:hypothetical protein